MPPANETRIDPAVVAELYEAHHAELSSFLVGVLRDSHLANDALQATFAKAVEVGHTAARESIKGWLFRVAWNEALVIRRRQQSQQRLLERAAWTREANSDSPFETATRGELVQVVRSALAKLPPEQRQVVCLRIYEGKTFAAIATELRVPLGTVLSRMQLAMRKLRENLEQSE